MRYRRSCSHKKTHDSLINPSRDCARCVTAVVGFIPGSMAHCHLARTRWRLMKRKESTKIKLCEWTERDKTIVRKTKKECGQDGRRKTDGSAAAPPACGCPGSSVPQHKYLHTHACPNSHVWVFSDPCTEPNIIYIKIWLLTLHLGLRLIRAAVVLLIFGRGHGGVRGGRDGCDGSFCRLQIELKRY